jgi:hypothetical protein
MAQARAGGSGTQISSITAIPKIFVSDITSSGATLRWANRPMTSKEIQRTGIELFFSLSYVLDHSEPDEVLGGDESVYVIEGGLPPLLQVWVFMRNVYGGIKSEFTSTNFITLDAPVAPDPITSLNLTYPNYKTAYTTWLNPVTPYTNISRNLSMRYNYSNVYSNTSTLAYGTTNQTTSNITPSTTGNFVQAKLDYIINLEGVPSATVSTDWFSNTQPILTIGVYEAFSNSIVLSVFTSTPLVTSDGFYIGYSTTDVPPTIPLPNQVYVASTEEVPQYITISGLSPGTNYYIYGCWVQNYTNYITGSPAVATGDVTSIYSSTSGGGGGVPSLEITIDVIGDTYFGIKLFTSEDIMPNFPLDGILVGYSTSDTITTPFENEAYVYPDGFVTYYTINGLNPNTFYYITGCCIVGGVRGTPFQVTGATERGFGGGGKEET